MTDLERYWLLSVKHFNMLPLNDFLIQKEVLQRMESNHGSEDISYFIDFEHNLHENDF